MIAHFCVRDKDNKALYPGYAFTTPAYFLDIHVIFLTFLDWLLIGPCRTSAFITEFMRVSLIVFHLLPSFCVIEHLLKEADCVSFNYARSLNRGILL